jgi:hypothetical protein
MSDECLNIQMQAMGDELECMVISDQFERRAEGSVNGCPARFHELKVNLPHPHLPGCFSPLDEQGSRGVNLCHMELS